MSTMSRTRTTRSTLIGALLLALLGALLSQAPSASAGELRYTTTVDRRDDVQRKNLDTGTTETLTGAAATGSGVEVTSTQFRYENRVVQIRVQFSTLGPDVDVRGQIRSTSSDFSGALAYYTGADGVRVTAGGNPVGPRCDGATVQRQEGSRGVITITLPEACVASRSVTGTATSYTPCVVDGSDARYQCMDPLSATSTTTPTPSKAITSPTTLSTTIYDRAGDVRGEEGELGTAASAALGLDVRTAVIEHRRSEIYVRMRFVDLVQGPVAVSGEVRASGQSASTTYQFTTRGTGSLRIEKRVSDRVTATCTGSARWAPGTDGLVYVSIPRSCVGNPAVATVDLFVDREDRDAADSIEPSTWLSRAAA